jgi:predicted transcriptional regulator of viral defense system
LCCAVNLENKNAPADRYIVASKINDSANLTYRSAFEVHGLSHQVSFIVYVASEQKISNFKFEGVLYKYVGKGIRDGITHYRLNNTIRLMDLEGTVMDSRTD